MELVIYSLVRSVSCICQHVAKMGSSLQAKNIYLKKKECLNLPDTLEADFTVETILPLVITEAEM